MSSIPPYKTIYDICWIQIGGEWVKVVDLQWYDLLGEDYQILAYRERGEFGSDGTRMADGPVTFVPYHMVTGFRL